MPHRVYRRYLALGAFVFTLGAAAQDLQVEARNYTTPTRKMKPAEYPTFDDDYDFRDLEIAIGRQLRRFANKDLTGTIRLGGRRYPLAKAARSLQAFRQLIKSFEVCAQNQPKPICYDSFNASVRDQFNVFAPALTKSDPRYGEPEWAFFTAYNSHPIEAQPQPGGAYSHPVYKLPPSASDRDKTRGEIDFHQALVGKGLELFYAKDLFELYLMQVEGSGYVTLNENGTPREYYVAYAGTNDKKWNWISAYMMEKGYISNPSVPAQRKFLRLNPQLHEEIFSKCPSYVFFRMSSDPATGSDGVPVTDGRSIATDRKLYAFKGLLAFVQSRRPEEGGPYDMEDETGANVPYRSFSRFFLDQDTGGAIKGKARADLYFGKSQYALYASTYQQQKGKIFFLLLK